MSATAYSFEAAEQACVDEGLTPFRVVFGTAQSDGVIGQVQSVETYGPGTYNHAKFCVNVKEHETYATTDWTIGGAK